VTEREVVELPNENAFNTESDPNENDDAESHLLPVPPSAPKDLNLQPLDITKVKREWRSIDERFFFFR
jgi:hypothetical protein